MNVKKRILLGVLILLALASAAAFIVYDWYYKRPLRSFTEIIKQGEVNDLHLTIYYMNPLSLTLVPWDVNYLIGACKNEAFTDISYIVAVNGYELNKHIDLLNQLCKQNIKPNIPNPRMNVRTYYVFQTTDNKKVLDVAMWGFDGSIYVNGVAVKDQSDIYYKVIIPYLPEEAAQNLQKFVDFS